MVKAVNLRIVLAFASALLAANAVFWALNTSATRLHPIGIGGQVSGILALLVSIAAGYGMVRYGLEDRLVRATAVLAIAGAVGTVFRWVPAVTLASAVACAGMLVMVMRRPSGARRLVVLALTLAISAVGFLLMAAASSLFVRCDPKHRWLCDLAGFGMMALVVLIECTAYSRSRTAFLEYRGTRPVSPGS